MTATVAVRERPILFSGEMVRAILDGRKSQTRRVVTKENSEFGSWGAQFWKFADLSRAYVDGQGSGSEYLHVPANDSPECIAAGFEGVVDRLRPRMAPAFAWDQEPDAAEGYLPPASRLWVRETWAARGKHTDRCTPIEIACNRSHFEIWYHEQCFNGATEKFNTDFLGRWRPSIHMPRALSRITLEITSVRVERLNAISEADAEAEGAESILVPPDGGSCPHVEGYRELWDSINAKRGYGWDVNPWVFVIEFARVTA